MFIGTKWFEISPYFSFRWVDNNLVSSYNTKPLESETDCLSYQQPIQCGGGGYQSDTGQIQLTSDFVPTCRLYSIDNVFIKDIALTPIDPPIMGKTFICYNGEVDFSDVDPGEYYGKITFTDDDEVVHVWCTSLLDVQIYHDGTQLFEVTNLTNEKSVVFVNPDLTTLVIKHRVGSKIRLPLPKSDSSDFEDQYNELTQEQSVPYIIYTQLLYGSNGFLLPTWVIEKINLLYSLDQVLIDGQPFTKVSNADFKPTRSDIGQQPGWWEVDIQPNDSYPSDEFITGTAPDGEYIVIKKQITFLAQSANFACNGIFNARKNLIRIAIVNNGEEAVTVKVGTAENDATYGILVLPADGTDSIDIGKLFKVATTVWVSGIAGANLDVTFDYNDYAAPNVPPPNPVTLFAKNTLYYFDEIVPGSFAVEFDVATGLGRVGTDHEGCVLADGRNGTPNRIGKLVRVWNALEVLPAATRGTDVGSNTINLTENQLPEHTHLIANGDTVNTPLTPGLILTQAHNQGTQRDYSLCGTSTAQDRGTTSVVGEGLDIDITNKAVILPAFYYIGV